MLLGLFPRGRVPIGFGATGTEHPPPPPRPPIPNGRWLAIGQNRMPRFTDLTPNINEEGFTIFFDVDLSPPFPLAGVAMVFVRPSGSTIETSEVVFGSGAIAGYLTGATTYVYHVTRAGELDEQGLWSLYLTKNGFEASGRGQFHVRGTVS